MKKNLYLAAICLSFSACDPADLQKVFGDIPLTQDEAALGLKEALNFGVDEAVENLSTRNGYYQSVYKILLPEEARVVTDKLKIIPGFSDLEEELLEKINRAAEDAAKSAGPIFAGAIRQMTFRDAMDILLGEKNAATRYLHSSTYTPLYDEFNPVVVESLNKFNALDYWRDAINSYNKLPLVDKVNPDLADHVTSSALYGLFDLVEKKEYAIRTDVSERTTALLRKVFAKQDS